MDRIEFIEMLQEKLDKQRKVYDELVKEKEEKYKYTSTYMHKMLQPKEHITMDLKMGNNITLTNPLWDSNTHQYTESKKSTTNMIIDVSYKIRKLEIECGDIRKEIDSFDDVRKIFPFLEDK